jgi:hypothetical protein
MLRKATPRESKAVTNWTNENPHAQRPFGQPTIRAMSERCLVD